MEPSAEANLAILTWAVMAVTVYLGCIIFEMFSKKGDGVRTDGYTAEYLQKVLGKIKVGGETLTGKCMGITDEGYRVFFVMVRNDDLFPPYQVSETIECPSCKYIVLPVGGCPCCLKTKRIPTFKSTSLGSFAHNHIVLEKL